MTYYRAKSSIEALVSEWPASAMAPWHQDDRMAGCSWDLGAVASALSSQSQSKRHAWKKMKEILSVHFPGLLLLRNEATDRAMVANVPGRHRRVSLSSILISRSSGTQSIQRTPSIQKNLLHHSPPQIPYSIVVRSHHSCTAVLNHVGASSLLPTRIEPPCPL